MALAQLGTGDNDKLLDYLEQAYSEGESMMVFLAVTPIFDNVRDDPRYQELLRKMGLLGLFHFKGEFNFFHAVVGYNRVS